MYARSSKTIEEKLCEWEWGVLSIMPRQFGCTTMFLLVSHSTILSQSNEYVFLRYRVLYFVLFAPESKISLCDATEKHDQQNKPRNRNKSLIFQNFLFQLHCLPFDGHNAIRVTNEQSSFMNRFLIWLFLFFIKYADVSWSLVRRTSRSLITSSFVDSQPVNTCSI